MLIVPVQPVANQTLNVVLGGQAVTLNVYQKSVGLFMDVLVNAIPIITGVLCENFNRIVRDLYLGFTGDLLWIDNQAQPVIPAPTTTPVAVGPGSGSMATLIPTVVGSDPVYTGLGSRYSLAYLTEADLAGFG